MPLNRLENFIRSTDGRILYVNPSDINATDAVTNDGTSLTRPFITLQRALLESARFSFLAGSNNDLVEKTSVLLYPGEYIVDNRPGWGIRNDSGTAKAYPPSGSSGSDPNASSVFSLELDSNFDLTQEDNILYKFNSINGGVIIPRGTSIIGLDLRKTKIRPKYVPNPTDLEIRKSAIFRVTGACYFWQFSMFDGDESGLVYTHPSDFSSINRSTPLFSHHKLTCFEYADGVNEIIIGSTNTGLTDLDMYYSKLSNAYNAYRTIPTNSKYPASSTEFAKREPEWKIVGAFASDPVGISSITLSGTVVTVTANDDHNLDIGTPIKIRGVVPSNYNISTKVQSVASSTQFTYLLSTVPVGLSPSPDTSSGTVTVETDTVSGASPYIFNCSLRSVWGMNGMFADGAKASGFRSMVVAQFTAVSLQKDDRAFVKYDPSGRSYNSINISTVVGSLLPAGASQTETTEVYHLDPQAIYRKGWESSHIKMANDAFIQIVSVFAIGFNKHFDLESGSDASITNSNSNFGQISLNSDGFRAEAFDKDNKAFITSIIPPRDISSTEETIEWLSIDVGLTTSVGVSTHLYLYGFNSEDSLPVSVTQGYRIGARVSDKLYLSINDIEYSANIYMQDGVTSSFKVYDVSTVSSSILTIGTHTLQTGEKIIINSETGDLPENVVPHTVYYTIRVNSTQIRLATSFTNALNNQSVTIYGGTQLKVYSRVSDKISGDIGSPIQFDESSNNWYLTVNSGNSIYNQINTLGVAGLSETTDLTYVKRILDDRSLDEKLYKVRVVIPKELIAAKDPQTGFVIQESSSTGARNNADFTTPTITSADFDYKKNPRFITTCTLSSTTVTVLTDLPHDLKVGDIVLIKNVSDSSNTTGEYDRGYNGKFAVSALGDSSGKYKETIFRYSTTDVNGVQHTPEPVSTNNTNNRTTALPRFERSNLQSNLYVYRNEVISPYVQGSQDGIYHLYVLNASNRITEEFDNLQFSQSPVDLYPQLDRDNPEANPPAAKTFALRFPIGDTNTSDLKKSITRETIDKTMTSIGVGLAITNFSGSTLSFDRNHGLGGIVAGIKTASTSGFNGGAAATFYNVKLLNGSSDPNSITSTWQGATAKVVLPGGGNISSIDIISSGSNYSLSSPNLYLDRTIVGDGNLSNQVFNITGISSSIGDVVQITGIGTVPDTYHRITAISNTNQISIGRTGGDPTPISGQYAFIVGPSSRITARPYSATTGITTFTTAIPHGLVSGNKFRVIDSSNNNRGDYVVNERVGVNTFTSVTNQSLSVTDGYILKHGLSANEGVSDISNENFAGRQVTLYGNEYLRLSTALTDSSAAIDTVAFTWFSSGIGTDVRFPLGSYIQIDNEIMRIISSGNATSFQVLRGVLGTRKEPHSTGSLIRKIHPVAVEFHRPSILRASGHTFEYLGYGPGNYSTSLPQIQIKSLSEREEFLVQAQERSCGTVVYTGMNNNGDSFNGNTKTSSVSGEITSYDIPTPTVTGQDPSKSSVVYDEVTIKEKLLVEGGDSGTVLSQFDGPVTFNQQTRFKNTATFSSNIRITSTTSSDSTGKGALTVKGGVGIGENLNVGGNVNVTGSTTFTGLLDANGGATIDNIRIGLTDNNTIDTSSGNLILNSGPGRIVAISTNTTISGVATVTGRLEVDNIRLDGNTLDTKTGNLTLNAPTGSSVSINTNLTVSGISTFTGRLEVDNIRLDGNTLDTKTGNLTLTAPTGSSVSINTNLTVSGISTFTGRLEVDNIRLDGNTLDTKTGNLTLNAPTGSSVGISTNLTVSGTSTLTGLLDANGGATIDNIRIGLTDNNTIDTSSGNLVLTAFAGSSVSINTNTTISGVATVTGRLEVDNIRLDGNTLDTKAGNLTLTAPTGSSVGISTNLTVASTADATSKDTGSIVTEGGIGVEKNVYVGGDLTVAGGDILLLGTTSGTTTIKSLAEANNNTLTLPKATGGSPITAVIARTSQADGTIGLGTDTSGNYVSDITAGDGLTKNTSPGEGQAPTLTVDSGVGIAVDANGVRLANSNSLTANTVLKWSSGGTNLANSSITDDGNGVNVSVGATISDVRIGITNSRRIDTSSGNLVLGAPTGSNVAISTNLTVSGTSTLTGLLDADGGATINNVNIGITNGRTIDAASGGNLILGAPTGNSVAISTNLTVSGTSTLTGLLDADGGATISNVNIGITNGRTIDAASGGNLILGAPTGNSVAISTNTTISGNLVVNTGTIEGKLEKSITVGIGLSSGQSLFDNTTNVTIRLGDPSGISSNSGNTVSGATHTHQLEQNAVTTQKIENQAITSRKLNGGQRDNAPIFGARAWGKMIGGIPPSTPEVEYGGNMEIGVNRTGTGRYVFTMFNVLQNNADDTTPGIGTIPSANETTWANQNFIVVANAGAEDVDHICSIDRTAGIATAAGRFGIVTVDNTGDDNVLVDTSVIYFVVFG